MFSPRTILQRKITRNKCYTCLNITLKPCTTGVTLIDTQVTTTVNCTSRYGNSFGFIMYEYYNMAVVLVLLFLDKLFVVLQTCDWQTSFAFEVWTCYDL